jgi:hypothetical protein
MHALLSESEWTDPFKNGRFHLRMEVGCRVQMTMETIHCGMESPFTIGNFCINKSDIHWKIGKSFSDVMSPLTVIKIDCPVLDDALLLVVSVALFSSC